MIDRIVVRRASRTASARNTAAPLTVRPYRTTASRPGSHNSSCSGVVSAASLAAMRSTRAGWGSGNGTSIDSTRCPCALSASRTAAPAWCTSAEVHQAGAAVREALRAQGHRVESMDVPFPDPHPALVDLIAASEAADTTPEQEELCDPGRLAVVRYGRTVSGAAVLRAEAVRLALRTTMRSIMASYDLLAMATVPIEPFDVDAIGPPWAAEPEDLAWTAWTPATYPFNLTGQPAISLPAGLSSAGLPIGVQLVGPFGGDKLVLSTALQVEAQLEPLPAVPDRVLEG